MQGTVEKEILDLEKRFWKSLKDKDIDAAMQLTDDPCIVSGAQGVARIDKQTFAKLMTTATWILHDFDIKEVQVQPLSDDVVVIGYKVHEDLTVNRQPLTLDAADASTWVRRNGRWVCALHTESVTGDPFGRDRQHQM